MSLANLRKVFKLADADDRREGQLAYRRYNDTMRMFSDFYGVPIEGVTAAFVALSPNSDYHGNLRSLASVLHAIQQGAPVENVTVSTYKHCRDRAYRYATGAEPFVTPERGPKTLAFYHNILDPEDKAHVTVDGHIVCAYHGVDRTMVEAKVRGRKEYRQISADMQKLAKREGLVPCQAQAIIWFARKRTLGIKYTAQLSLFADPTDKWNTRLHPKDVKPYE